MISAQYKPLAQLDTVEKFKAYLHQHQIDLPFDEVVASGENAPLNRPVTVQGHEIGNRFCILPLEGWDCTPDGRPTEATHARWRNFGRSGAKTALDRIGRSA